MDRSMYDRAVICMAAVHLVHQGTDLPGMSEEEQAIIVEYGRLLICVRELIWDIQEQSNIGDELCKDLIHQTFLPNLPEGLWKVFGFEA